MSQQIIYNKFKSRNYDQRKFDISLISHLAMLLPNDRFMIVVNFLQIFQEFSFLVFKTSVFIYQLTVYIH